MNKFSKFIALAFELTGLIIAGVFLGMLIGETLGSKNIGAFWGIVVSFSFWVYRLIILTKDKT